MQQTEAELRLKVLRLERELADTCRVFEGQIKALKEWKDAIIDAAVVDWVYTPEHDTNPQKAVNDLLCWQSHLALDPAVSEEAARMAGSAERWRRRTFLFKAAKDHLKLRLAACETSRQRVLTALQWLKAGDKTVCECGTTMVCPDIGCDKNKVYPEGR